MKNKHFHPLISGGITGLASWTFTYPLDVINVIPPKYFYCRCFKAKKMWSGYKICAFRAILLNGINFWVYETVRKNYMKK